jgi:hypothetical protein
VEQLAALMAQHGVHRVPVVEKGRLVGIAARSDLMRAVLGQLVAGEGSGGDQAIRQDIMAALNRQPWLRNTSLRLKVADGVVELTGLVYHDSQRHAARVIAENVAGVKRVDDRLGLIDPLSGLLCAARSAGARCAVKGQARGNAAAPATGRIVNQKIEYILAIGTA